MSRPVRILLLEVPQLLRGILEHAIELQSDCELVRDTRRTIDMVKAPGAMPDIVILGLSAAEDATLVHTLFARWPGARVMTVMHGGEEAAVYELEPHAHTVSRPSEHDIVERLRDAVERSRAAWGPQP